MQTVTISSKYQISIPKKIREEQDIKPGQRFIIVSVGDRIEMVRERKMEDLRGILPGLDTSLDREREDRV